MALLHKATIVPSKLELLARWLPGRSWGGDGAVTRVAAARFDDPAGQVGIETMIIRAGEGGLLHVPLTYRGAPLAGAEAFLIGTTEHSVLGTRWVYDAVGDPVYVAQLAETIRAAGREAPEEVESDGVRVAREPDLALRGSGAEPPAFGDVVEVTGDDPVAVRSSTHELTVARRLGASLPGATLTGAWDGDGAPAVLAALTTR
ncbi:hypothetical protein FHR83_004278 [Actinoplanes campanulatus]|uniref:Maltokinase N-terminal cap domain-containing protein n=1 Tax=Actinoplanes campanulatus TaxID=113559 RepID=A0A7W5AIK9_9ACTN|nr:hypothetical protein [Actinoplanes campanulatus]MBB3096604.1 hypothetical protein [Actinoplanes campanulatus]GGN30130.1 hypothetical protein GCM10010109_49560 [Actinoplanes campanulatus]GID37143.1 hypothetical protein Aca09nite_36490 [Actinoplanes campanulatus]